MKKIKKIRLVDVIRRNTGIGVGVQAGNVQDDIWHYYEQ